MWEGASSGVGVGTVLRPERKLRALPARRRPWRVSGCVDHIVGGRRDLEKRAFGPKKCSQDQWRGRGRHSCPLGRMPPGIVRAAGPPVVPPPRAPRPVLAQLTGWAPGSHWV